MLETLRQRIAAGLQNLSVRLQRASTVEGLPRHECPVLILFHGYSLAHTIRPLVVGRAPRGRGYPVEFAGVGPRADRITAEGFQVYEVETMPHGRVRSLQCLRLLQCRVDRPLFHFWYASIWPDPFLPEETLLGDLVAFHQAYAHGSTSRLRDLRILLDHHPTWAEPSGAQIP